MFQFTLPHGERPTFCLAEISLQCFNSRSRMGSDNDGL